MEDRERKALETVVEVFDLKCREFKKSGVSPLIYQKGKDEQFSEWFVGNIKQLIEKKYGVNEHPDYVMKESVGMELKSFEGNKKSIEFNSTMPCGGFRHKGDEGECYYAVASYKKEREYGYMTSFCICDGDYFNHDREFAFSQSTETVKEIGSYGDGSVRYRPFFNFPNPLRQVPGISFISKFDDAHKINPNLVLEGYFDRDDSAGDSKLRFYVYRHIMLHGSKV